MTTLASGHFRLFTCSSPFILSVCGSIGAIASLGGTISFNALSVDRNHATTGIGGQLKSLGIQASGGAMHFENTRGAILKSVFRTNTAAGVNGNYFGGISSIASTPASGGAVSIVGGDIQIDHTEFIRNVAQAGGGGTFGTMGQGGALCSEGPVAIRFSSFAANSAIGGGGRFGGADGRGGAWFNLSESSASESVFHNNSAVGGDALNGASPQPRGTGSGGAIANSGTLFLTNTTAALNAAQGGVNRGFAPYSGDASGGCHR